MQLMEGNLIAALEANFPMIGHIHVADVPGQTAPGKGEINYPNVLATLARLGYRGHIDLEYSPGANRENELAAVIAALKLGA